MRLTLAAALLLATSAMPAIAQQAPALERRVSKLEGEMRAVQRKVFPNGPQSLLEPEIAPVAAPAAPSGAPASSALADLTARVDGLERQVATLTGQVEEGGFRIRKLEEAVETLRAAQAALAAPPAPAVVEPPLPSAAAEGSAVEGVETTSAQGAAPAATGDRAEDAYLTGFRAWEAKRYDAAIAALEPVARTFPRHRRASYAQNLLGRAYLDSGRPASAAKALLSNYQTNPKGERAADSLYFLGQSLVALKKPTEACQVYAELADVYRGTMRDWVAQRLPKARADAKCE